MRKSDDGSFTTEIAELHDVDCVLLIDADFRPDKETVFTMTWYPDLGTETMVSEGPHVRAIGWLSSEHEFPTGETPPAVLERVREFCQRWQECLEALSFGLFMGVHQCELCGKFHAHGNLGVPAGALLCVFPEMLAHYIEVHRYARPAEFVTALLDSPLPGTPEYDALAAPFRELQLAWLERNFS